MILKEGEKPPKGLKKSLKYYRMWTDRILNLALSDPDAEQTLQNLLPRYDNPNPQDKMSLLENLDLNPEWKGPGLALREYLMGNWKLQAVIDNLDLIKDVDVDDEEFLKEIKEVDLVEFLENV